MSGTGQVSSDPSNSSAIACGRSGDARRVMREDRTRLLDRQQRRTITRDAERFDRTRHMLAWS